MEKVHKNDTSFKIWFNIGQAEISFQVKTFKHPYAPSSIHTHKHRATQKEREDLVLA